MKIGPGVKHIKQDDLVFYIGEKVLASKVLHPPTGGDKSLMQVGSPPSMNTRLFPKIELRQSLVTATLRSQPCLAVPSQLDLV